jgi:acyl dehydratase
VNYGFNRLRFPAPVPAGARIRARVTLQSVEEIGGGVQMAWQVVVEIENQVKPALAAEWLLRMYF